MHFLGLRIIRKENLLGKYYNKITINYKNNIKTYNKYIHSVKEEEAKVMNLLSIS